MSWEGLPQVSGENKHFGLENFVDMFFLTLLHCILQIIGVSGSELAEIRGKYGWNVVHSAFPLEKEFTFASASFEDNRPVYVSLATTSFRFDTVHGTVNSILRGNVLPNKVFVLVSTDAKLLDEGISPANANSIAEKILPDLRGLVEIVYVKNIGPHRKLLPLMAQMLPRECLIVTVDDDLHYAPFFLENLIHDFIATGSQYIVANRVRRIGFCIDSADSWQLAPYTKELLNSTKGSMAVAWPYMRPLRKEMLVIPTGMGGVLYSPSLLSLPVLFDSAFISLTATNDDLHFRLASLASGTRVYSSDYRPRAHATNATTHQRQLQSTAAELNLWSDVNANTKNNVMLERAARHAAVHHNLSLFSVVEEHLHTDRYRCLKANVDKVFHQIRNEMKETDKSAGQRRRNGVLEGLRRISQRVSGMTKLTRNKLYQLAVMIETESSSPEIYERYLSALEICGFFVCSERVVYEKQ